MLFIPYSTRVIQLIMQFFNLSVEINSEKNDFKKIISNSLLKNSTYNIIRYLYYL